MRRLGIGNNQNKRVSLLFLVECVALIASQINIGGVSSVNGGGGKRVLIQRLTQPGHYYSKEAAGNVYLNTEEDLNQLIKVTSPNSYESLKVHPHYQDVNSQNYNQEDPNQPPPRDYAFAYAVNDGDKGDDFSHKEARDGNKGQVIGEYRVKLPDNRLQIVRYTADSATGFKADVTYEGEKLTHSEAEEAVKQSHTNPNLFQKVSYAGEQTTNVFTNYVPPPSHHQSQGQIQTQSLAPTTYKPRKILIRSRRPLYLSHEDSIVGSASPTQSARIYYTKTSESPRAAIIKRKRITIPVTTTLSPSGRVTKIYRFTKDPHNQKRRVIYRVTPTPRLHLLENNHLDHSGGVGGEDDSSTAFSHTPGSNLHQQQLSQQQPQHHSHQVYKLISPHSQTVVHSHHQHNNQPSREIIHGHSHSIGESHQHQIPQETEAQKLPFTISHTIGKLSESKLIPIEHFKAGPATTPSSTSSGNFGHYSPNTHNLIPSPSFAPVTASPTPYTNSYNSYNTYNSGDEAHIANAGNFDSLFVRVQQPSSAAASASSVHIPPVKSSLATYSSSGINKVSPSIKPSSLYIKSHAKSIRTSPGQVFYIHQNHHQLQSDANDVLKSGSSIHNRAQSHGVKEDSSSGVPVHTTTHPYILGAADYGNNVGYSTSNEKNEESGHIQNFQKTHPHSHNNDIPDDYIQHLRNQFLHEEPAPSSNIYQHQQHHSGQQQQQQVEEPIPFNGHGYTTFVREYMYDDGPDKVVQNAQNVQNVQNIHDPNISNQIYHQQQSSQQQQQQFYIDNNHGAFQRRRKK